MMDINPQLNLNKKNLIMEKFEVTELTLDEMILIDGGRTISYYIGLVIGATVGTAVSLIKGIQDGLDGHHA